MEPNLTPAAPKRPLSKTVRRAIIGSTVAVVAGVGGVAAYAGGAYAAETPAPDASASASATPGDSGTGSGTTTNQDAQRGPGGHGGPGGHRGGGFGGPGAVTSTAVVQAADGTITTEISADGEVTEVSSTSITLKGADGSQTVFAVPADVTLADTIVVGANVDARGTVADNVNTLSHVHVEGEKPTAPADGTAPAAPADGTAPAAPAERPTLLHATSVVEDRENEGQFVTRVMQTGEVTAVSDTSITVKSADGFSATYALGTDVTTDAAVGDTVSVGGTQSGDTNTAERIGSGDEGLRGPGGHGGMGERGEKPADPADPATPADPADPATPADPADPATPADPADPAAPADSADPAAPASGATTGDTAPTGLTQNGANLPSLSSLI